MNAANPSASAIVLFGHGARDPEWAGPMRRIRDAALARPGAPRVELAFLEFMSPTLPEAIAALAAEGAHKVAVVPIFLAQGGHLKRDLPEMLAAWSEKDLPRPVGAMTESMMPRWNSSHMGDIPRSLSTMVAKRSTT